jgi:hypothetical protein
VTANCLGPDGKPVYLCSGSTPEPLVCINEYTATNMNMPPSYTPWGCTAEQLCETVRFAATPTGEPSSTGASDTLEYELNPAATKCALEALRDGKAGKLTVIWDDGGLADFNKSVQADIFLLGDGTVLYESRESWGCCGLYKVYKSGRLRLKDKATFDACIAAPEGAARASCFLGFSSTEVMSGNEGAPPWTTGTCDEKTPACLP